MNVFFQNIVVDDPIDNDLDYAQLALDIEYDNDDDNGDDSDEVD